MPKVAVTRGVRHAASEMFDLVADVERYPQFVPLCEGLELRSRTSESGRDVLLCDMSVGYRAIRETFTTRVTLDRRTMAIGLAHVAGPFRRLAGSWRFDPKGPRECVVHFSVDYEFRSRILAMMMGGMFDNAFGKFIDAFEARADAVFGTPV